MEFSTNYSKPGILTENVIGYLHEGTDVCDRLINRMARSLVLFPATQHLLWLLCLAIYSRYLELLVLHSTQCLKCVRTTSALARASAPSLQMWTVSRARVIESRGRVMKTPVSHSGVQGSNFGPEAGYS
jgi:hypothetical protein